MKKIAIISALCISMLFGSNTIDIGEFSVKSTLQGNSTKIEIFKGKKPFQEITEEWPNPCGVNFLFTGIYEKEPLAFAIICDNKYSAAEYNYDPKTQKFIYAGAIEDIYIKELAQTKEYFIGLSYGSFMEGGAYENGHFTGLSYDSEDGGAYEQVLIFEKPSNKLVQRIYGEASQSEEKLDLGYSMYCTGACISVGDYNFDGAGDFSLFYSYSRVGGDYRIYFLYDPKKKEFVLGEFGGANLAFDEKTKTIAQDDSYEINFGAINIYTVFKIVNNKMEKIKESCALVYYGEESETFLKYDCKEGWWDGFWQLSSTGLKKNFQLFAALSENKTKGVAIYKGQAEFITLSLNAKNGDSYIYDEIIQGKKNGKYAFTITEGEMTAASYINKNGKKFELENAGY
ncbi:MAG: hypothetical protein LBB59_01355 [Campylobacteraceae bacterium]|jgi:hypothetical protein|nr:hypothetical protein [Campylobacteraceae bacterium]